MGSSHDNAYAAVVNCSGTGRESRSGKEGETRAVPKVTGDLAGGSSHPGRLGALRPWLRRRAAGVADEAMVPTPWCSS